MPILDSNPILNETISIGSRTWRFNGTGWEIVSDGWTVIPQIAKTGAYTLEATNTGSHISITTGGITVPSGVFDIGDTVVLYNNSASSQTITQGASVTMRQAGTTNTGNRTLAAYGIATVMCVAADTFVISGSGLS